VGTPISSDDTLRLGHAWGAQRGPGMHITFRCAKCNQPRNSLGRKLMRVQGVKQYVCKGCQ
jgi:hypothetical protein